MNNIIPKEMANINLPYTLAFRLPSNIINIVKIFQKKLINYCETLEPLETLHITIKYLGYESKSMNDEYIKKLLPDLSKICKPFIPIQIKVKGLDYFVTDNVVKSAVIYLKVFSSNSLENLHMSVMEKLQNKIEHFPHADGKNYIPHITISKNLKNYDCSFIQLLIRRSKKFGVRRAKLSDLVVLTPKAIYPIDC